QSMARDLAAMGQQIEQLKASVAELKASQQPVAAPAARTSEVRPSEIKPPAPAPRPRMSAALPAATGGGPGPPAPADRCLSARPGRRRSADTTGGSPCRAARASAARTSRGRYGWRAGGAAAIAVAPVTGAWSGLRYFSLAAVSMQ